MPETYTPSANQPPATYTMPNDTETALADGANGLKARILKPLADAAEWSKQQITAQGTGLDSVFATLLRGLDRDWLRIRASRPNSVVISPIPALVVLEGGSPVVFTNTNTVTLTPSLTANTWHFVYAWSSGGVLSWEVSTTAPDAMLAFKTGDTSRRYICALRGDGIGKILPFGQHGRMAMYAWGWTAISVPGLVPPAALSFSSFVPPTSRLVWTLGPVAQYPGGFSGLPRPFAIQGGVSPEERFAPLMLSDSQTIPIFPGALTTFGQISVGANQSGVNMELLNPGNNGALGISVTGKDISVTLATDGAGAITTRRDALVDLICETPAAAALLSAIDFTGPASATATAVAKKSVGFDQAPRDVSVTVAGYSE